MPISPPGSVGMESIQDSHFMAAPCESPLPTAWDVLTVVPPLSANTFSTIVYRAGWMIPEPVNADQLFQRYLSISWTYNFTFGTVTSGSGFASYTGLGTDCGMVTTNSGGYGTPAGYIATVPSFPGHDGGFNSNSYTYTFSDPPDSMTGTMTCTLGSLQNFNLQLTAEAMITPPWPANIDGAYNNNYQSNSNGAGHGMVGGYINYSYPFVNTNVPPPETISDWQTAFVGVGCQPLDDVMYPISGNPQPNYPVLAYSLPLTPGQILLTGEVVINSINGFSTTGNTTVSFFSATFSTQRLIWPWTTPQTWIIAEMVGGVFADLSPGSPQTIHNDSSGTFLYGSVKDLGSWAKGAALPYHFTDPATGKDCLATNVIRQLFVNQSFADFAALNFPSASII